MGCFQFQTGIGTIAVSWNDDNGLLRSIDWLDDEEEDSGSGEAREQPGLHPLSFIPSLSETPPVVAQLIISLHEFFRSGKPLDEFPWEEIDRRHWTDFQNQVYRVLREIPHGETRTYSWVAQRVGKWSASRAVGQALRRNPLLILLPCHRVVAATTIGGFMGISDPRQPELKLKNRLIELEYNYRNPMFTFLQMDMMRPLMREIA